MLEEEEDEEAEMGEARICEIGGRAGGCTSSSRRRTRILREGARRVGSNDGRLRVCSQL